jgi:beta-glucanase (GH16 family)
MSLDLTRRQMIVAAAAASQAGGAAHAAPPAGVSPRPSFFDNFSGGLDRARWKTNYWFGDQKDASSRAIPNERQIYVDQTYCGISPFRASPAGLVITADKNRDPADPKLFDPYTGRKSPRPYTSGLITTETSFNQRYGYFEAKMSFPRTRGCWPAFWLLGPPNSDHAGDEIDIIEWVASNPRRLFFTTHLAGAAKATWVDGFDTAKPVRYGLLWTPERLEWFVDGRSVHQRPNPGLNAPMYMLVNLAVGGWDQNLPEDPSGFPASMTVASVSAFPLGR